MLSQPEGSTVLLSDREGAPALAELLRTGAEPPACIANLGELVGRQPLSSIAVLVLHTRPVPNGLVLVALGRLNLEYPGIQKIAFLAGDPPLPVAEYLTSCGVDILLDHANEDGAARLAATIDNLKERTRWITS